MDKKNSARRWIMKHADNESANEFFNTNGSRVDEDTGDIWVGNEEDVNGFVDGNWADEQSLEQYVEWMKVTYPQVEY